MSVAQRGLGRGLGALIPTSPVNEDEADSDPSGARFRAAVSPDLTTVPGLTLLEVATDAIATNPRQPRSVFDPDALDELATSLQQVGFLQPLVVRPSGEGYELVAGERRLRAAQRAGMTSVPVLVRETPDSDLLRDALLENLHRVQLNPLEEASAYAQLLSDFGCTQEELATRLGRSRPAVTNALRLLRLPVGVQRRVAAGVLSAGHARALVALEDEAVVEALAARIVAEGLSVRAVEEAIAVGEAGEPARPRRRTARSGAHNELAAELADRLDTRVRVTGTVGRGRIVIEFGSPEDLQRVLAAMKNSDTWV
ncbi:MAG: ParB family transcriptional regulator, chromosome partitioning protein [Actinomycetota bacterium]|nr:ParB family transcriptional regulator, chromosome partitioning protein [Actinomycetota bacterium]